MKRRIEQIGPHTLYLGDCLEIMAEIPDGTVDAVVTDPPYGIGIAGNPVRQKHERSDWDDSPATEEQMRKIMEIADYQIIWGGNYYSLPPRQGFLVWDKVQPAEFTLSQVEQAWISENRPAKLFRRHVVSFKKDHPTQKPLELMEWCLGFIPKAKTILDPFMGSGTTGVACSNLGRKFIGIEIEPKYFDIACRRIEQAEAQVKMDFDKPKAEQTGLAL